MNKDGILRFPNSKRKLTEEEERLVKCCANLIHNCYSDNNPFVKEKQRIIQTEEQLRMLVKQVFEINEDEHYGEKL